MSSLHLRHRHLDVACELDAVGMSDRTEEWERLRADFCVRAETIPGGARLWLRREAGPEAGDLARREADCCGFLDVDLVSEGRRLRLDLTSPAPEAAPVIAQLVGVEPVSAPSGAHRPLHAAAGAFTALHQAVELAFGTGVIGQSAVGLGPAIAASAVLDGGWVYLAGRRRAGPVLAFLAGLGIGVPAVHFRLWPWRLRPVPVLTEAEGLPRRLMPVYNAILYGWAVAAGLALLRETPRRERFLAVPGIISVFAARRAVERHFEWMAAEGKRNPQWWNRAWR
jgi:hypothetical protein